MSGDRSRLLKVGEYVYWEGRKADRGKVVEIDWSAVTIRWDNGLTNSICHNDMVNVSLAPVKSLIMIVWTGSLGSVLRGLLRDRAG